MSTQIVTDQSEVITGREWTFTDGVYFRDARGVRLFRWQTIYSTDKGMVKVWREVHPLSIREGYRHAA